MDPGTIHRLIASGRQHKMGVGRPRARHAVVHRTDVRGASDCEGMPVRS